MKDFYDQVRNAAEKFEAKLSGAAEDVGKIGVIHQYTLADNSELTINISVERAQPGKDQS